MTGPILLRGRSRCLSKVEIGPIDLNSMRKPLWLRRVVERSGLKKRSALLSRGLCLRRNESYITERRDIGL